MKILAKQNIRDIVFIDIETAPADPNFNKNSPYYDAWKYYYDKQDFEDTLVQSYRRLSPLMAEFGIIVCITIGIVSKNQIRLKTFSGAERLLLGEFNAMLDKTVSLKSWLCGHSITVFDAPFISKRCIVNRVPLHSFFDVAHLKPWEVPYLDIATLWKGTGYKTSSLISMCTALGVPHPKDDISGADVGRLFYEGQIKRICIYCEKDVISTINCFMAMCYGDPLEVAVETLTTN
mgnify:CR=1 FL=1|tara:strand:+ start:4771 stop:5472 length:702 start_codon:yes stop_codon:yes gene_type:complete